LAIAPALGGQVPTPPASTGSIVGTVVDAESGDPLAAATVRILEAHGVEIVRGDGRFEFQGLPPGTYTLTAGRLGYADRTRAVEVTAGAPSEVRMELQIAAVRLGGVVATGAITARSERDLRQPNWIGRSMGPSRRPFVPNPE
jgi:iron complex outermembrane receptor protein